MSELPPTGPAAGEPIPDPDDKGGVQAALARRAVKLKGSGLREHAAHGTMINAVFMIGLNVLGLVRGFILAGLVAREDYGLWGILAVSMGTVLFLKQVGVGDKYIQQDDLDQEAAFQKAFTLEFWFNMVFATIMIALIPLIAAVYDEPKLIAPGLVLVALLPATALHAPVWIYWRRMDFLRARLIASIDPLVGAAVGITMAALGFGYWAFAGAALAGAWATVIATVAVSPYPLRLRYDRGTMRSYFSFAWPLAISGGAGLVIAQSGVLATKLSISLAAVGTISLASSVTQFTHRVDTVISGVLYPAICVVKDRTDLLYESFAKTNRMGLMWAVPFGLGMALFSADLMDFAIGEQWKEGLIVFQAYGLIAAVAHIGWNWEAYYRARGDTRPIAISAVLTMVVWLAAGVPLLLAYGLTGLAIGNAIQAAVHLACRITFLKRLFKDFTFWRHATSAFLPAVPAALAVLALRLVEPDERTLWIALGEMTVFVAITVAATWRLEGGLLKEAVGYLRGSRAAAPA